MKNFFWIAISTAIVAVMSYLTSTPTDFARAQDGPELVLTPDSGPCDATIQVSGTGYEAGVVINVSILRPHSEGRYAILATLTTDSEGAFIVDAELGSAGCEVAVRDADFDDVGAEDPFLVIGGSSDSPTGGSKVAFYEYTTLGVGEGGGASPTHGSVSPPLVPTPATPASAAGPDDDGGDSSWIWAAGVGGAILVFASLAGFTFIRSRQ